jgi:hypothetical protein
MSGPYDDPFGSKHVGKPVNILHNKECAFVGYIELLAESMFGVKDFCDSCNL